jgi:serine/threonine-protein kinase HipA
LVVADRRDDMTTLAEVRIWGRLIGAVLLDDGEDSAVFQYDSDFIRSGLDVSPLTMPLASAPYSFPGLSHETFNGLPGLLADSLPDRFGNSLIDVWLASEGRPPESFNAVERLCYVGTRGMGALEFAPPNGPTPLGREDLDVAALIRLASEVLTDRERLIASLDESGKEHALRTILSIGTSAGGARAKAVIAWNPKTNVVRSGPIEPGDGFEHWLLKFDGVSGNQDKELEDPQNYGVIEYAYSIMARSAGIEMTECRLLEEGGRHHFMTRRFDRPDGNVKLHMHSLGGLAHFDFNRSGEHSYEQALQAIRRLHLSMAAVEQQFRRMVFNVIARNQDDHVKNIAFLMDPKGQWALSPAFDMTHSYSPTGMWTNRHQMSINGKLEDFNVDDFRACGEVASMKRGRTDYIFDEVREAVRKWPSFASDAGVPAETAEAIERDHVLDLGVPTARSKKSGPHKRG